MAGFRATAFAVIASVAFCSAHTARATDRFWSGSSGSSDNISDSTNWFGNVNPNSGDNLYFNNTTGFRHFANSNYGAGSFFGEIVTYNGAGGIRWTGDKTFLNKFENNNDGSLLEATATLSNRTGPDGDLQINPVGSGGVKIANVDLQNGRQLQVYGTNLLTVAGIISQSGTGNASLSLLGAATVQLQSANTYNGGTTVSAGRLLVNGGVAGTSSGTGTGAVTVNNGGSLLGGTGAISGAVTVNAGAKITGGTAGSSNVIMTGNVGTLNTGALTLASTSIFLADITGATSYDVLNVTGTVNVTGATLTLNIPTGLTFAYGQRLTLIANDGIDAITGTFANLAQGSTFSTNGYVFMANYAGGTGNDFDLVAVPEPGTVAVGILALGSLSLSQRRRVRRWLGARLTGLAVVA